MWFCFHGDATLCRLIRRAADEKSVQVEEALDRWGQKSLDPDQRLLRKVGRQIRQDHQLRTPTDHTTAVSTRSSGWMVEKYGRKPSQVKEALAKFSDDPGEAGNDPIYGKGRINVARALGL